MIPSAGRAAVGGERAGALVVRVVAPPVEGAANEALVRALAKALGIPAGQVRIERGASAREKVVSVPAASVERVRELA